MRWRLELSCFSFDIVYRPGKRNYVADALSRASGITAPLFQVNDLMRIHESLCHPGVQRLNHIVRQRNLPFSVEEVRSVIHRCETCAKLKPNFIKHQGTLIKATRPFERLSIDYKGPLPSSSKNKYLLNVVDEYSRFPFAFPTKDMAADTTIRCLTSLFLVWGLPEYVHSDRGPAFISSEYQNFMHEKGVATSYSSSYNPRGNGQIERTNGTLWRTIRLALASRRLPVEAWGLVLPDALHSMRSLLCVATNQTPHERMFVHPRKTMNGQALPSWLKSDNSALLKRIARKSKYEHDTEAVRILHVNPQWAKVLHSDGKESTVPLRHLAPTGNIARHTDENRSVGAERGEHSDAFG